MTNKEFENAPNHSRDETNSVGTIRADRLAIDPKVVPVTIAIDPTAAEKAIKAIEAALLKIEKAVRDIEDRIQVTINDK